MNRRQPHPTEPDKFDDRRELADLIWQDQVATIEAGGKFNAHGSALYWLGYRAWALAYRSGGISPPDSMIRRRRLLNSFHGKPFHAELERHLNGIGWQRPPDREAEERAALLQAYVEIDEDGTVRWGFHDTPGRDLIFKAFCERFELIVFNGLDHLARETSTEWDSETTIVKLGLTDDDYRFEVSAGRDTWWFGELRFQRHHRDHFDFSERDGHWIELEDQGWEWDGETPDSVRVHTEAVLAPEVQAARQAEKEEARTEAERMLAEREAEEALYANRKANADMRIVAMAQRNWKGDRLHPGRGYGANWYRTLWALGYRPRVWHGSLVQPEPTAPFTAAEAREEVKVWDGWIPFAEELERLEGIAPQEKRHWEPPAFAARSFTDEFVRKAVEKARSDGDDEALRYWQEVRGIQMNAEEALSAAGARPAPPKPEPDPKLLAAARANFKQRHSAEGGGADWYMTLVAYGDDPEWLADTPSPETTNIVAHLKARAMLWAGWNRWVADLERIGANEG